MTNQPKPRPRHAEACFKCSGSGVFYGAGSVVNGVFKGFTGPCFACEGKGWQTRGDKRRCDAYWRRHARIA